MTDQIFIPISLLLAYLLGSVPSAVWYGKSVHDIDIRNEGSGNAGATNTFRVLGQKAGSIVMAMDVTKGVLATSLPILLARALEYDATMDITYLKLICGLIAVLGHVLPVFASFKGGKGVATLLGMAIALHPVAAGACLLLFLIVLSVSKYVSLGSMVAALAFPIYMSIPALNKGQIDHTLVYVGVGILLLVVYTHRKNVSRLMNGEENKTYLFKSKDRE